MDGASTQAVRKSSKCVEEVLAKPLFFWFAKGHLVFWCIGALAASARPPVPLPAPMPSTPQQPTLSEDEEVAALRALLNSGPRTNRARPPALSPNKSPARPGAAASGDQAARLLELLQDKSGLDQARPMLEAELRQREATKGPNSPETLLSVTCLAMLLQAKGELAEARPLYERALMGFEKQYGPNHRDTLIAVNNLAVLLKSMGQLDAARPLYERVLAGDEQQLGPSHPHTLDSVYNLARLLHAEGKTAEAIPLFQRELAGCEQQYGITHNETKTSAANLYNLHLELGQTKPAEALRVKYALG
jgi:tetratricopeptide (TPR) repeat protein